MCTVSIKWSVISPHKWICTMDSTNLQIRTFIHCSSELQIIYILTLYNIYVEGTYRFPVLVRRNTIVKAIAVRCHLNNQSVVNTSGKRLLHWKVSKREFILLNKVCVVVFTPYYIDKHYAVGDCLQTAYFMLHALANNICNVSKHTLAFKPFCSICQGCGTFPY